MAIWLTSRGAAKNGAIRRKQEVRSAARGRPIFHRAPCRCGRVHALERPRPPGRPQPDGRPARRRCTERRRGLHVHRDRAGGAQLGPLRAAYDVVGAGSGPVCTVRPRAAGPQPAALTQQAGAGAGGVPRRIAGLVGDDHVPGAHPGREARHRSRWRRPAALGDRSARASALGDGPLGRLRAHAGTERRSTGPRALRRGRRRAARTARCRARRRSAAAGPRPCGPSRPSGPLRRGL